MHNYLYAYLNERVLEMYKWANLVRLLINLK